MIQNGQPAKREYRGQRSVEAFVEFVKKQLADPIKEFFSLHEIHEFDVCIRPFNVYIIVSVKFNSIIFS